MKHDNSPQEASQRAKRVLLCLRHGRRNAIIGRDLRQLTGLPDRELRLTLEHIRRGGMVIVADNAGYYLPETAAEVRAYIQQEEHRSANHWRTLAAARELYEQMQEGEASE